MKIRIMGAAGLLVVVVALVVGGMLLAAPATPQADVGGATATPASLASAGSPNSPGSTPSTPSTGSGQAVIDWNLLLLDIVRTPGAQPGTVHPTRSFAILDGAMYDAIVSITRDAPPYTVSEVAPASASPDAAAAVAGHDVLAALYPAYAATIETELGRQLGGIPAGSATDAGIRIGHQIAGQLIAERASDSSGDAPKPAALKGGPGAYVPTPPAFAAPAFTSWSKVTPFALKTAAQFRPAAPPALDSPAYAQAVNEVESLGRNSSTTRTADQTVAAKFWAGPIWNTWNEIAATAALAHHTGLEQTARLFASLNMALADSVIAFYDAKYTYALWRPISAIRAAGTDGNATTVADPTWTPLAATPADPSYPGAHSTVSAAAAAVLAAFFGDHDQIQVTSDVLPGVVRSFDSYSAVATEAGLSRIYAGVHTRLDHEAGVTLGHAVARWVLEANLDIGPWVGSPAS